MSTIVGRVLVSTRVSHTRTFYVGSTPTDPDSGTVTVTVRRMDGTEVDQPDGDTATATGSPGAFSYRPAAVAVPDVHSLTWEATIAGAPVSMVDYVDYVGGYLFGLAELRKKYGGLTQYSDADLADARTQAEIECERICGWAMVPRFAWCVIPGSGGQFLVPEIGGRRVNGIRDVRAASIDDVPLTGDALTGLRVSPWGTVRRPLGVVWPAEANVRIELEHGYDFPPGEIPPQVAKRARYWLGAAKSGIPDRATSWTTNEGGTYRMMMPGADSTGDPDVDAVYGRYGATTARKRSAFA